MNSPPPPRVQRLRRWLAGGGLLAIATAAALGAIWPAAILPAYRFALFALLAPSVGSMVYLLIHRCTGGAWGGPLRPFLAAGSQLAPWLWLLVAPLLFFSPVTGSIWSYDSGLMLGLRALGYALVLFGVALALARTRAGWVGPAGLIALVFMLHLLSDDWLVTLEPGWHSTAFSLTWVTGMAVAGLSGAILGALAWGHSPDAPGATAARPVGIDWGNLLLTTAMMWCYLLFAEFLIIWAGNVPRETAWFLRRIQGGWVVIPWLLVALQFVLPLALLLSRARKRAAGSLALAAGMLLLAQIVFAAWLVIPAFPAGHTWNGVFIAGLLATGFLALGLRHFLRRADVPSNTP